MQLRHIASLLPATEGMCKVTSIAFSPNNRRLAVVTVDRVVHMFDAQSGERKDKFSTKASEKVRLNNVSFPLYNPTPLTASGREDLRSPRTCIFT